MAEDTDTITLTAEIVAAYAAGNKISASSPAASETLSSALHASKSQSVSR